MKIETKYSELLRKTTKSQLVVFFKKSRGSRTIGASGILKN